MQVYASGFRNTVIKRDTDLLTPQEMVTHKEEVQAAILEELKTWLKNINASLECREIVPQTSWTPGSWRNGRKLKAQMASPGALSECA